MLTPPQGYWEAMQNRGRIHFKMEFDNGVVLTDRDIDVSTGVTITDAFNSDSDLKMGKVVSKQLSTRIILSDRTSSINWSNPFKMYFGVEDANHDTLWVYYGTFTGKRPKNVSTASAIDFIAYDKMIVFDQTADEWLDGITYPITVSGMLTSIGTELGITIQAVDQLSNAYNRSFGMSRFKKDTYTFREILEDISEALGCYARICPSEESGGDYVHLVWFNDDIVEYRGTVTRNQQFYEEHADFYAGMTWDEFDALTLAEQEALTWDEASGYYIERNRFDGVFVAKIDVGTNAKYPSRVKGHLYNIKDNPIMYISSSNKATHVTNYVVPIYNRIIGFGGVLPLTIECVGDLVTEAGDIIQVELPEGTIMSPIYYKTMHWNGTITDRYETTAPET